MVLKDEYKGVNSCFIFKNTLEIVRKLEQLGYVKSSSYSADCNNIWVSGDRIYNISFNENFFSDRYEGQYINGLYGIFCGKNEKMFFDICSSFCSKNYKIGDFLYELPSDDPYIIDDPENQRVFIFNGTITGDGYGILLGWHEGKIKSSTGTKNFCYGGNVRKASDSEIKQFMNAVMNQDIIRKY